MPWPVRSKLLAFYVANNPASTWIVVGTVPAGKTWLVKQFTWYNGGAAARKYILGIRIGGVDAIVQLEPALAVDRVGGTAGLSMVLPEGAQLLLWVSASGPTHFHVSGAQLG